MKNYLRDYSRADMKKIIEKDDRRYKETALAISTIVDEFSKYTGKRYGARTQKNNAGY